MVHTAHTIKLNASVRMISGGEANRSSLSEAEFSKWKRIYGERSLLCSKFSAFKLPFLIDRYFEADEILSSDSLNIGPHVPALLLLSRRYRVQREEVTKMIKTVVTRNLEPS